jgi:peptide deformylase|tara:strand:+ start:31 stop:795 length:765 start_codon:yes stop_codon:yes gene_type:complete
MADKLTPAKIEEAAKHYENITSGKTPILEKDKGLLKEQQPILDSQAKPINDMHEYLKKKDPTSYPLIPPTDPRLLMKIAPYTDDMLKEFNIEDRKDLSKKMYNSMVKYGGIGLSANQVGLPFRMFVMGGHPQIEEGKVRNVFNPLIVDFSEETILMKEGCLSFPFLFLSITRPKWVNVKYTDENGEIVEEYLHGMPARIFQHENEHMNGYIFTDLVSKLKLERGKKAQAKLVKQTIRRQQQRLSNEVKATAIKV